MITQIVIMSIVICFFYSAKVAKKNTRVAVLRNVQNCLNCPMKNKRKLEKIEKPSLTSFKKSIRPQENIVEINIKD